MSIYQYDFKEIDLSKLLKEIPTEISTGITSIVTSLDKIKVYTNITLSTAQQSALGNIITAHDPTPAADWRLHRFIEDMDHFDQKDFTIVGLTKTKPIRDRGRKTQAIYIDPKTDEPVVEKIFTDVYVNENGVDYYELQIEFYYYREDGSKELVKTELAVKYNMIEDKDILEEMFMKRRERQKAKLVSSAKGTPGEAYLDLLLDYFKNEIDAYIINGSDKWEVAIKNHGPVSTDPSIIQNQIHAILESKPENALTIRQAILYQITGSIS